MCKQGPVEAILAMNSNHESRMLLSMEIGLSNDCDVKNGWALHEF